MLCCLVHLGPDVGRFIPGHANGGDEAILQFSDEVFDLFYLILSRLLISVGADHLFFDEDLHRFHRF